MVHILHNPWGDQPALNAGVMLELCAEVPAGWVFIFLFLCVCAARGMVKVPHSTQGTNAAEGIRLASQKSRLKRRLPEHLVQMSASNVD